MTPVRKRSRLITVDGVTYRWRVRYRPTYHQGNDWSPLSFGIENAGSPCRVPVVSLPAGHPRNWILMRLMASQPTTVWACVRIAFGAGWTLAPAVMRRHRAVHLGIPAIRAAVPPAARTEALA